MKVGTDILENELIEQFPGVLEILLVDRSSNRNILWATSNYNHLGKEFDYKSEILLKNITGDYGEIIMPRVYKDKVLQKSRSKKMAEVFTPSWVCNEQINSIDNNWFGKSNVFNKEVVDEAGVREWKTIKSKVTFTKGKDWKEYVALTRLEISCGEAPYITSRYEVTTSEFIPVENRIGFLDRKLRIVSENCTTSKDWLKWARKSYCSIYAFEFQGDSLLLAREAMLMTFIENYELKFQKKPALRSIISIANIISWNVFQMDGLKGVVPGSCTTEISTVDLFGSKVIGRRGCRGCLDGGVDFHDGVYVTIIDWEKKDPKLKTKGKRIKFIDLIKS